MGIKGLLKFLTECADKSFRDVTLDHYAGKIVACNATMSMTHFLLSTQFMASVGTGMLVDELGDPTAHLTGLFSRTIQLIETGIKPVWVFSKLASDLAPNSHYIKNRQREIRGFPKRSTKITPEMSADAIKMLKLLGLPYVEAPENAEAQCAELVKAGKCYAAISEDTEALAFGCNIVIKGVKSRHDPVVEMNLDEILRKLDITYYEFVDLCILLGTKKCRSITGMGGKSAYKFIQQCSTIENILDKIVRGQKRFNLPKDYDYLGQRKLFLEPTVESVEGLELVWKMPDEDSLKQFLIADKGFSATRVEGGLKTIFTRYHKPTQLKIENFFDTPLKRLPVQQKAKKKKKFGFKKFGGNKFYKPK